MSARELIENLEVCIQDPSKDRMDSVGAAVWRIMEDVRSSYRLAMEGEGMDPDRVDEIQNIVGDYLTNHYGDL